MSVNPHKKSLDLLDFARACSGSSRKIKKEQDKPIRSVFDPETIADYKIGTRILEPAPVEVKVVKDMGRATFVRVISTVAHEMVDLYKIENRIGKYSFIAVVSRNDNRMYAGNVFVAKKDGTILRHMKVACKYHETNSITVLKYCGFEVVTTLSRKRS